MYLSYVETSRLDTSGLLNVSNNVLKIFSLLINQINKLHFQIVEMKTLIFFIIKMFVKYLKSNFLVIPGWLAHSSLSIYFINIPLSTFNNIYKFGGNYCEKKTFKHSKNPGLHSTGAVSKCNNLSVSIRSGSQMTSPGPGLSSPMLIVETQLNSRRKYYMDICVCKFRI